MAADGHRTPSAGSDASCLIGGGQQTALLKIANRQGLRVVAQMGYSTINQKTTNMLANAGHPNQNHHLIAEC